MYIKYKNVCLFKYMRYLFNLMVPTSIYKKNILKQAVILNVYINSGDSLSMLHSQFFIS